jgi:hypothetical protein
MREAPMRPSTCSMPAAFAGCCWLHHWHGLPPKQAYAKPFADRCTQERTMTTHILQAHAMQAQLQKLRSLKTSM